METFWDYFTFNNVQIFTSPIRAVDSFSNPGVLVVIDCLSLFCPLFWTPAIYSASMSWYGIIQIFIKFQIFNIVICNNIYNLYLYLNYSTLHYYSLLACQFLASSIWSTTYFPISCRPFVSKIALLWYIKRALLLTRIEKTQE